MIGDILSGEYQGVDRRLSHLPEGVVPLMWDIIVLGVLAGGVLGLIAVGLTLVFGVMDVVNFSHGDFVMIGMMLTASLVISAGFTPYVAALIVVGIVALLAVAVYFGIFRAIAGRSLYVQIFATLGLGIVLQSATLLIFGPQDLAFNDPFASTRVNVLGVNVQLGRVIAFGAGVFLVALLWFGLHRTRLGRQIRAVSQDRMAAATIGLRTRRAFLIVFVVGVSLAALAGALIVPFQSASPTSGLTIGLTSFVVVVLGGFGSVPGALVGGFIVGVAQTAAGFYLGPEWQQAALFVIFLLILLLRPQGIFGRGSGDSALVGGQG